MQRLEVIGAVRPIYGSLGVKRLIYPSSGTCDCVVKLPHRSFCRYIGMRNTIALSQQTDLYRH